jgi:hypothetical protein
VKEKRQEDQQYYFQIQTQMLGLPFDSYWNSNYNFLLHLFGTSAFLPGIWTRNSLDLALPLPCMHLSFHYGEEVTTRDKQDEQND